MKAPEVEELRRRLVLQANAALSMPIPMTGIAEVSRQAEEMISLQAEQIAKSVTIDHANAMAAQAREEGRREGLEQAAAYCDRKMKANPDSGQYSNAAFGIRTLAPQEKPT